MVTLKGADNSFGSVYALTHELHDTKGDPAVSKANLASDFDHLSGAFQLWTSFAFQLIDLWPVFEQEILPFALGTSTKDIAALLGRLKRDPFMESEGSGETKWFRKQRYDRFDRDIDRFNQALNEAVASISISAQRFYDKHFAELGQKVELRVGITAKVLLLRPLWT